MKYLFCALAVCLASALPAPAAEIAFVNVNVVTMADDNVLREQTVVVREGRITAIGPVDDTALTEGTEVIDGTDRFLMPGLAEMHGHIPAAAAGDLQRVMTLFVANGVTSVRGMQGGVSHLAMRGRLERGELLGPRLVTAGPSINGGSVSNPAQAVAMVRRQAAAGYDFLKIHPGLTRAEFRATAATAAETGMRFAGHVPDAVGVPLALELGISSIDHLDGYMQQLIPADVDPTGGIGGFFGVSLARIAERGRIPAIVAQTLAAGTWNVPTESLFENMISDEPPASMRNWPEMQYMPAETVQRWAERKRELQSSADFDRAVADRAIELRRALIRELHRQGAGLLLGSDAPQVFNVPGFSLHRELHYLVVSGLTPYEALQTGTIAAARWFGVSGEAGTVAVGKRADLVLLDDNPLADIANSRRVHGVMLRGRWFDRRRLDELLSRYERSN
ncbi:MAG TPA: amidohydrolase family protein [Woeseiaceae bacterium]|nr:amidohydrolase family protein [Woeseiaceae bacterium]